MDETLVARVRPNSIEAEQSVIGSMIVDADAIDVAGGILTREDFYYSQYGIIFDAILDIRNSMGKVDLVTIVTKLREMGAPAEVADPGFLSEIAGAVPLATNIESYAGIVHQKSLLRQIIDMNQRIEKTCYEQQSSVEDILDQAEQGFMTMLQNKGVSDFVPIKEVVMNALKNIEFAVAMKGEITGTPTGFVDLDYVTSGLQNSDLILIAARPSMGKTAFVLNIANYVTLEKNLATAIFSLEMSKEQLVNRLFSLGTGIDAQKLRTGNLDDYDWPRLVESAGNIGNSKLIIDDTPAISISELRSKCRKLKQERDISLIIIDYLQLMTTNGKSESRQQEISNISRSLKALARELNVPVVALSQLNRGLEAREDKRPMLSDLRDSGAIEQDADVVMLLYRDDYYNKDSSKKGISEVIVAKQRNGPTGTIELTWIPEYTKFANREKARNKIQQD